MQVRAREPALGKRGALPQSREGFRSSRRGADPTSQVRSDVGAFDTLRRREKRGLCHASRVKREIVAVGRHFQIGRELRSERRQEARLARLLDVDVWSLAAILLRDHMLSYLRKGALGLQLGESPALKAHGLLRSI